MAGLDATEVKKACMLNWMTLGVYRTREVLCKMKKSKSNLCTACPMNAICSLVHYLLYWEFSKEIREKFLPQFILSNSRISSLLNNEAALMVSILDPESSLLPKEIRFNWESSSLIYSLSLDFAFNIHRKFEKIYGDTSWTLRATCHIWTGGKSANKPATIKQVYPNFLSCIKPTNVI